MVSGIDKHDEKREMISEIDKHNEIGIWYRELINMMQSEYVIGEI